MSARSYNAATSSGQQQQYRNDGGDSRAGFGGSTPINMNNNDQPQNIMYDRRVIRGSTYSLRRSIENRLNDIDKQSNNTSSKRNTLKRNSSKRRIKTRKMDDNKNNIKTPRPISGRLHAEIQTDPYLEEIYVTKKEKDFGTQTDPFLDRPSTPLFIPKLSGKSIATQIEDGDLFDFDREIEAILEVLIGKTIEQSLMEVLEEEELKSYQKYKAEFEEKRNMELAKCQRLEEEERRREQEKERRIKQNEMEKKEQLILKKRITAQRIATEFLENIENAVFTELDKRGHFEDPIIKEIETVFIPKLLKDVKLKVNHTKISNIIIDDVIQNTVKNMINDSIEIINKRDQIQKEYEREEILKRKLNEKFVEKRKEFTEAIKSQKEDYDFKQQIIEFLNIPITAPKIEENDNDKNEENENEENEEKEEEELGAEIQENIEYIDKLIEEFGNDEEALWKQISSMLDKIGGEISDKIKQIDEYLEVFSIKSYKKELLNMFEIYKEKEDEENLKKAIIDCLGIDTFDEESHNKFLEAFKSEEQKNKMESIHQMVKEKENIKQFVTNFIKQKEEERIAAEEAAKAKEAEENEENEENE